MSGKSAAMEAFGKHIFLKAQSGRVYDYGVRVASGDCDTVERVRVIVVKQYSAPTNQEIEQKLLQKPKAG